MEKALEQRSNSCVKIVLLGPESTGKTTLAKQLATYYKTQWVPEFMRTYLQKKWDLSNTRITKEDLLPIAIGQMASENNIAENTTDVLFCDTNLLEMQVYCEYYYDGWCPNEIEEAVKGNEYHLYFLTGINVPWQQDDLRDRPFDRSAIFRNFENALKQRKLPFVTLNGSREERLKQAVAELDIRFRI